MSRLLLLLTALALRLIRCAAQGATCDELNNQISRLNPAFWPPSFVFRSLMVRAGDVHPPNLTRTANSSFKLLGACQPAGFRADNFAWRKPTSDGGDWIATTATKPLSLNIDGISCVLTGVAVVTTSWPSLRLQFDEGCPRKTAVEVPLVNATGGIKLVHWMCKVVVESNLCKQAAAKLSSEADRSRVWGDQLSLDLTPLAQAASRGATRMSVYVQCYENLDWFIINSPLAVDPAEYEMLLSIRSLLEPTLPIIPKLNASIVVETVCMPDCMDRVGELCLPKSSQIVVHTSPPPTVTVGDAWDVFVADSRDSGVAPWLFGFLAAFFLLGMALACCCLVSGDPPAKPERKIKSVSVVYHDVPEGPERQFFSIR